MVTLNKKNTFNLISNISINVSFSFLKNNNISINQKNNINGICSNNKLSNLPNTNSSIDIKSLMFQKRKNNIMNKNNNNNANALSEEKDNVNINIIETISSNQLFNTYKNDEIMHLNFFLTNNPEINKNNKKINIIEYTQNLLLMKIHIKIYIIVIIMRKKIILKIII